ncbi:cyclophilin-like fold protein [Micromonospora yasonensis]|uniref:cyclophilin-like fold protein n=1 Tax=Micromonospora yasonensis TaxID=1128667 RepID=UPI00222EF80F|nr:cyclophilin-like fold protein [Micromonospora yasonensis]MCW3844514.1 cyclophilin-like fold protein [Micromonospora yasonensis]
MRTKNLAAALVLTLSLAACGAPSTGEATPTAAPSTPEASSAPQSRTSTTPPSIDQAIVGTVVRFTVGSESVDVTIVEDSPATRDFLSMLPLTLTLEEFNGREKIADLPRALKYEGSPGSDPKDGDLIYFIPWGNIGFYYNTDGIGYSDQTLHLGTYDGTAKELERLEGHKAAVAIVR